jgi:hypothetical protein
MTAKPPRTHKPKKRWDDVRMNINNKYYEVNIPYPKKPVKPFLPLKHGSVEAKEYALQLNYYERLEVVYYSRKKEVLILVGYFMAMVLFSLYPPQWLT